MRGPNYRRIVGPDVAHAVASAHAVAGWLTVVVPVASTFVSLDALAEQSRPSGARASVLQPIGDRAMWSIGWNSAVAASAIAERMASCVASRVSLVVGRRTVQRWNGCAD